MNLTPPAPSTPPRLLSFKGLVDSGADSCAIPEQAIHSLGLPRADRRKTADWKGLIHDEWFYSVHLYLPQSGHGQIVFATVTKWNYVILGRDFLNRIDLSLLGTLKELQIF